MKYFVFTFAGLGLPVAWQLQREGREVTVGIIEDQSTVLSDLERTSEGEPAEKRRRRLLLHEGILKKVPADQLIEQILKEPNPEDCFVFFDDNNQFRYAERLKDLPIHGNFPTEDDHLFEIDRKRAKQFADEHYPKLAVGENKEFAKVQQGIDFLTGTDDIWVLKGKAEEARTVVPDTIDPQLANGQIIEALKSDAAGYEAAGYILELYIPTVIELTPEKFYYNGEPVCTTLDIENKPLGSGNLSFQTGCAQDLVFETDLAAKINQVAFPPIVDELARQHKGWFIWDASLLIDSRTGRMYFGEYCSNRVGYNCIFSELAMSSSLDNFFIAITKGKSPYRQGQVGVSARLFNLQRNDEGLSTPGGLINYKDAIAPSLWPWDIELVKSHWQTVGSDRNLAVITAAGNSVTEAVNRLYRNIDGFAFEGMYYRPKFDFTSRDYPTAILNRLMYGLEKNLYTISFAP